MLETKVVHLHIVIIIPHPVQACHVNTFYYHGGVEEGITFLDLWVQFDSKPCLIDDFYIWTCTRQAHSLRSDICCQAAKIKLNFWIVCIVQKIPPQYWSGSGSR